MKSRFGITILLVGAMAAPLLAQTTGPATQSAMLAQLRTLAKDLRKNAASWEKQEPEVDPSEGTLRGIVYDKAALVDLGKVVTSIADKDAAGKEPKDPKNLYVINKLLSQLLTAKPDVIRDSLPIVRKLYQSYAFKKLPVYSPAQIKDTFGSPEVNKVTNPTDLLRKYEAIQKRRQKKYDDEMPIILRNLQVYELSRIYFNLMALADDAAVDQALIKIMTDTEKKNSYAFHWALEAMAAQIPKMSPQRAKKFYTALVKLGEESHYEKKVYVDMGHAVFETIQNSAFPQPTVYLGIEFLTFANQFAKASKDPDVIVPKPEDVEAFLAKHPHR